MNTLEESLSATKRWAIALYATGGVGSDLCTALVPWRSAWRVPPDAATAHALAAALVAGRRTLGASWRPIAAIDAHTATVLATAQTLGTLALLRSAELATLPSPTDVPPGPFALEHSTPEHYDPHTGALTEAHPGAPPLILVFCAGPNAEAIRTVCVDADPRYAAPGEEGLVCDLVRSLWTELDTRWRFTAAIDAASARIVATPALIGQMATLLGQ